MSLSATKRSISALPPKSSEACTYPAPGYSTRHLAPTGHLPHGMLHMRMWCSSMDAKAAGVLMSRAGRADMGRWGSRTCWHVGLADGQVLHHVQVGPPAGERQEGLRH